MENRQIAKSTELSTPQPNLSTRSRIIAALTEANCFRGAEPTKTYLQLFSARLEQENLELLFKALNTLGEREREEGETTLLPLASILREIRILTPRPKTIVDLEDEMMANERAMAMREVGRE